MTRVDFYILPTNNLQSRQVVACKLVEKVYRSGLTAFVYTESENQSRILDEMLWTFRAGSFIPHALVGKAQHDLAPVLVGHIVNSIDMNDVLINLSTKTPACVERFKRIAELVDQDPEIRQAGRQRYRFYQERGYKIDTHQLNNSA